MLLKLTNLHKILLDFIYNWLITTNHKKIEIIYLVTGILCGCVVLLYRIIKRELSIVNFKYYIHKFYLHITLDLIYFVFNLIFSIYNVKINYKNFN